MVGLVETCEPRRRREAVERIRANEGRGGGVSAETRGERGGDGESKGDERRGGADGCVEDIAHRLPPDSPERRAGL